MLRQFSTERIVGFFLVDLLGTLSMLLLAAGLRDRVGDLPALPGIVEEWPGAYGVGTLPPQAIALVTLIWPAFFVAFSVYDGRRNGTLRAELGSVATAVCVSTLVLAGVLFFTYRETSRLLIVIFFLADLVLLLGGRLLLWIIRRAQNGRGMAQRRAVLVVGAGDVGQNVVRQLQEHAWADVNLVGYLDDDAGKQGKDIAGLPVLGTLDEVIGIIKTHKVQDAIVALPMHAHERLVSVCQALQEASVRVHVVPDLFALSFPSATLDGFGGIPVIDLGQPGFYGWRRMLKRAFDIVVTLPIVILLSPLMALVAILVKVESPGPAIFKQERIGENGVPFTFYKFRSMRCDADPEVHRAHVKRLIEENIELCSSGEGNGSLKMEDDPRITRVGRFIRKTSIDELPQFFNVLKGDMSMVGPRPPIPYEVDVYKEWHRRRFEAPPGITGWWQVRGRNQVSFDEMVRMDIYYVEHQSFWLDLKILFMTPWAVISGRGAG
jgi:exopolysaccharide biosynthesis polyprenyl glycosylphosphotransferase